jgi:hypothetical protein
MVTFTPWGRATGNLPIRDIVYSSTLLPDFQKQFTTDALPPGLVAGHYPA